ncbi:2-oxo acid dehydrogenase subunit E2 [Dactylosporangium sp. CS-047395]|uniref:2-oxo acid dehydrogenase subunit E2 n=1 Tax=Dactylosporangium sp. CS-047395 TaxID=3239936 RepID=UPI003D8A7BC9
MAELAVPKLNSNDDRYLLLAWLAPDGEPVAEGTPVAEVETSKAVEELTAATAGVLHHRTPSGADIEPGQVIAVIAATGDTFTAAVTQQTQPGPTITTPARTAIAELGIGEEIGNEIGTELGDAIAAAVTQQAQTGPTITTPARAAMAELGIGEEQVAALGLAIVRRADVETLAGGPAATAAEGNVLSRNQRAVARTVSRSAATIPAAYTAMTVDVGAALARAPELARAVRRPVGLAELFVAAIGRVHAAEPMCFARIDDDGVTLHPAAAAHVGVTVDVGEGLYVPVVRDAGTATLADIARTLTRHRVAAAGGTFREADLNGANITLTLHLDAHVSLAIPIVFPGQTCAVAVTAPRPELYLDDDDRPATRTVVQAGLAYDHRVVNGRDAARFLSALATALEPR